MGDRTLRPQPTAQLNSALPAAHTSSKRMASLAAPAMARTLNSLTSWSEKLRPYSLRCVLPSQNSVCSLPACMHGQGFFEAERGARRDHCRHVGAALDVSTQGWGACAQGGSLGLVRLSEVGMAALAQ